MSSVFKSLTHGLTITEYSDWQIFVERLNEALRIGKIRQVPVLKRGESSSVGNTGEEWFLDTETGQIYLYVKPDDHGPIWQSVDIWKHLEPSNSAPLSLFPIGNVTPMMAHIMKLKLEDLITRGLAEELPRSPAPYARKHETERRFRDRESNIVYRLREYYGLTDPDDLRWEIVPSGELTSRVQ